MARNPSQDEPVDSTPDASAESRINVPRVLQQAMQVFDGQLDDDALEVLQDNWQPRAYVGNLDKTLPDILKANPDVTILIWGDDHYDIGGEKLVAANAETLKRYGFVGLAVEVPMNYQYIFDAFNSGSMPPEKLEEWFEDSFINAKYSPDFDVFRGQVFIIDAPRNDDDTLDTDKIQEMFPDKDLSQYNEFTLRNMVMARNINQIQAEHGIKLNVSTGSSHNYLVDPLDDDKFHLGKALPNALVFSVLPEHDNFQEGQLYMGNGLTEHYAVITQKDESTERLTIKVWIPSARRNLIPTDWKEYHEAALRGGDFLKEFIYDVNSLHRAFESDDFSRHLDRQFEAEKNADKKPSVSQESDPYGGIKVDLPPLPKSRTKGQNPSR